MSNKHFVTQYVAKQVHKIIVNLTFCYYIHFMTTTNFWMCKSKRVVILRKCYTQLLYKQYDIYLKNRLCIKLYFQWYLYKMNRKSEYIWNYSIRWGIQLILKKRCHTVVSWIYETCAWILIMMFKVFGGITQIHLKIWQQTNNTHGISWD